ncbi:MAG: GspE/PulE family protein [Phycisphaerales bacterium]
MLSQADFVVAALVEEGVLSRQDAEHAGRHAAEQRSSIDDALVALGLIEPRALAIARAGVCERPYIDLGHFDIDLNNASMLPRSVADKHGAFPLFNLGRVVTVGMADPLDLRGVDRIRDLLKAEVETVQCEPRALAALVARAYSLTGGVAEPPATVQATTESADPEGPLVAAVNGIISQAIDQGASDIHLGPDEQQLHLRYRIDGALQPRQGPPLAAHAGLVQRIKVMATLDLTQTRRPQDGKFRFQHCNREVDVRASIIPTVCGENVVLRLLAGSAALGSLDGLGFAPDTAAAMEEMISHPHGMILATGPTGSGKTTTLYSLLTRLNTPDRNVVTIEDPVEMRMPMVRQVQVHSEIGMTFAGALRSILRQDPDVLLVGEIRDEETARIAVQAALTGHIVLSTLHTNDAPGAIARLRDFGCPDFAVNASLLGVLAQRLIRRVCVDCARPYEPEPALVRRFGPAGDQGTYRCGAGCPKCQGTGNRGRIGVYELLRMSPQVQAQVEAGVSTAALRAAAIERGMRPLWRDGLDKARLGLVMLEEVARVAAGSTEADISQPMRAAA